MESDMIKITFGKAVPDWTGNLTVRVKFDGEEVGLLYDGGRSWGWYIGKRIEKRLGEVKGRPIYYESLAAAKQALLSRVENSE